MDLAGGNVIGGDHLKEAASPPSLFGPKRYTVPRLMVVKKGTFLCSYFPSEV